MEPSANDIGAVASAMGEAQQQPAPITSQPSPQSPAPTQQSFEAQPSTLAEPAPLTTPSEPATIPETTPSETQPAQQPQVSESQPSQDDDPFAELYRQFEENPVTPPAREQTYEEYIDGVLAGLPEAPTEQPDMSQVDPEDPESIKGFFDDLMTTAEKRFEANYARNQAIKQSEQRLWGEAFNKYGTLRDNQPLRDMVHAIRKNEFDRGVAITPTQAADRLLTALKDQYQKGIADNQVQTTIERVQPQGGGSQDVTTTLNEENTLQAIQEGGEQALAQILDGYFKNS